MRNGSKRLPRDDEDSVRGIACQEQRVDVLVNNAGELRSLQSPIKRTDALDTSLHLTPRVAYRTKCPTLSPFPTAFVAGIVINSSIASTTPAVRHMQNAASGTLFLI